MDPMECNNWSEKNAQFVIVQNVLLPLIGRDLFDTLGIWIKEQQTTNKTVHCINTHNPIKEKINIEFPGLTTQIGKSKNHTVKSNFQKKIHVSHQKGRKVPMNIQDKIKIEIENLLKQGHIEKLDSDKSFITPIVKAVKKNAPKNLALDSKVLSKSIRKYKYQMPNTTSFTNYKLKGGAKRFIIHNSRFAKTLIASSIYISKPRRIATLKYLPAI